MTTKFITTMFLTLFGGKLIMEQVPAINELLNADLVNKTLYNVVLFMFCMLWATKFALTLYDRYLGIRKKYKK